MPETMFAELMMSFPCRVLVCSMSTMDTISNARKSIRLKKRRTNKIKLRTLFGIRNWELGIKVQHKNRIIVEIILNHNYKFGITFLNFFPVFVTIPIPNYKFLIPFTTQIYFIKNGILAIFLSAIPVPRTTARSGSSATCTGNFILCEIRLSSPLSNAPPPVRYSPLR